MPILLVSLRSAFPGATVALTSLLPLESGSHTHQQHGHRWPGLCQLPWPKSQSRPSVCKLRPEGSCWKSSLEPVGWCGCYIPGTAVTCSACVKNTLQAAVHTDFPSHLHGCATIPCFIPMEFPFSVSSGKSCWNGQLFLSQACPELAVIAGSYPSNP